MKDFSFIEKASPEVIEDLYAQYKKNPHLVEESWRNFFKGFEFYQLPDKLPPKNFELGAVTGGANGYHESPTYLNLNKDIKVHNMKEAYRKYGHFFSKLNPLNPQEVRVKIDWLNFSQFGFTDSEIPEAKSVAEEMGKIYCASIGVEFKYIQDPQKISWWESQVEKNQNKTEFTQEQKIEFYTHLTQAEGFENFLHTKFVGQKRFSLEGGISLIPAIEYGIEEAAKLGVEDVVIGMPHRGRLNVLVNVMQKPYENLLSEFEGGMFSPGVSGSGDVKYHLGYSSDRLLNSGKKVHLSMAFNPSHLEIVNPVLQGMAKAKQYYLHHDDQAKVLPILMHGDAAFSGQGVVMEVLNMAKVSAYSTGGTVHIIVNNQVGFTTDSCDARSTPYASDIAKMVEVPVLHVNGDDIEACAHVMRLAIEYRQKFLSDVIVDIICYRKYGHNEGDEPRFSQPKMYALIDQHKNPQVLYKNQLLEKARADVKVELESLLEKIQKDFKAQLELALETSRKNKMGMQISSLQRSWSKIKKPGAEDLLKPVTTKVTKTDLEKVARAMVTVPQGVNPVSKALKILKDREEMVFSGKDMDWGCAEMLAYGSLISQGISVRLTGQDVRRGTFTHRHATVADQNTGEKICLINSVSKEGSRFEVYDSTLSEEAVMGFEYGYSTAFPYGLTIWEAQFGDFANGAQVVIDQFIAASETKWQRMSGLVLLLPHGYEGQGPEHSSARPERFLQLAAENNMFIMNLTRPDQIFHALRRQVLADWRKPMIVMSPKSLLRHPKAVCKLEDLSSGTFKEVLVDPRNPKNVKKVILCTGKIYYELEEKRAEKKREDVAIVRLEQLYPFFQDEVQKILQGYGAKEICWVQEEPENQGYWWYIRSKFDKMNSPISYVGRAEAAAPATGFHKRHVEEQAQLMEAALK